MSYVEMADVYRQTNRANDRCDADDSQLANAIAPAGYLFGLLNLPFCAAFIPGSPYVHAHSNFSSSA